jgi:hypothetical protein
MLMRSHSWSTRSGLSSCGGNSARRRNASRASATIWVQAAVSVTASRMGSVIRDIESA